LDTGCGLQVAEKIASLQHRCATTVLTYASNALTPARTAKEICPVEPTSSLLIVVLLGGCGGLLVLVVRLKRWAVKAVCGASVIMLATLIGVAEVNNYYGYYTSWGPLFNDLAGNRQALGLTSATVQVRSHEALAGTVQQIVLPGARSKINRTGLIYLPPQYHKPSLSHTRFPVVELLHGSPGKPANWVVTLKVARIADELISRHLMGPLVLVMPSINAGHHYQECVNGSAAADDTYLATDVPNDVRAHFRVSRVPAEWGLAGYSSGGYCAANLSLRHRSAYGAAAILDGYYRAADGAAALALGNNPQALTANSPLDVARRLPAGTQPLPAYWIEAGTGANGDYLRARDFIAAMKNLEQVSFVVEPRAGHNFYAWSAALPSMLAWMWQQLAPPTLRTAFPIAGPPTSVQVPPLLPPRPGHG